MRPAEVFSVPGRIGQGSAACHVGISIPVEVVGDLPQLAIASNKEVGGDVHVWEGFQAGAAVRSSVIRPVRVALPALRPHCRWAGLVASR